jgi:hypothetical protein
MDVPARRGDGVGVGRVLLRMSKTIVAIASGRTLKTSAGAVGHLLIPERGNKLAQGLNSARSAARPSHEAIEDETTADEGNKSDGERMVHAATTIRIRLRISLR